MKTSTETWLARHAFAAYFVLAYALTWSLWVPIALSSPNRISSACAAKSTSSAALSKPAGSAR